ncbi:hypothetical protein V6N13_090735 [Hibiscus sabdariffa]|uniref:Uncharacterized protein n=1 Tax=Hibiscus sabdariffa TaxID=183260 RepID=A0ABR2BQI7_9ROSI
MVLQNLFSFSIATKFCQLEEINVSDCHNMTWLIVEEEEMSENENLEFRQLRSSKLTSLASFNGLWYSEKTLESVTWIFDEKVSCPVLEELWLFQMSGIEKIWNGGWLSVQSLTSLTV